MLATRVGLPFATNDRNDDSRPQKEVTIEFRDLRTSKRIHAMAYGPRVLPLPTGREESQELRDPMTMPISVR
jgi:hypothetical protein